jgi:hypothetical protein
MARMGDALSLRSRLNGVCKKKPGSKPEKEERHGREDGHQRFLELERESK